MMMLDPDKIRYLILGAMKKLGRMQEAEVPQFGEPTASMAPPFATVPRLDELRLRDSARACGYLGRSGNSALTGTSISFCPGGAQCKRSSAFAEMLRSTMRIGWGCPVISTVAGKLDFHANMIALHGLERPQEGILGNFAGGQYGLGF